MVICDKVVNQDTCVIVFHLSRFISAVVSPCCCFLVLIAKRFSLKVWGHKTNVTPPHITEMPLSTVFLLDFWNCSNSVVFYVFHFITRNHIVTRFISYLI